MKHCPRCGLDLPDAYRFCKTCGGALVEIVLRCPNCAAAVQPGWNFCKQCRVRLVQATPPAHAAEAAPLAREPAAAPPSALALARCHVCQGLVEPEARFCEHCGTPRAASAAPQAYADAPAAAYEPAAAPPQTGTVVAPPIEEVAAPAPPSPPAEEASVIEPEPEAVPPADTDEPAEDGDELVSESHGGGEADARRERLRPWLIAGAAVAALLVAAIGVTGWYLWKGRGRVAVRPAPTPQRAADPTPTLAPSPPDGMVYVPGGTFLMGRDDGDDYERPAHEESVKPFYMDRHEVTRALYGEFLKATGHGPPPGWRDDDVDGERAQLPVVGVSWADARAYAEWAGKRLPTEVEWEYAARSADGRRYPWGGDWRPNAANAAGTNAGGFVAVGSNADGASPFGVLDMAGNAWEWTATDLAPYPGGRLPAGTYENPKVIRGGSWQSGEQQATTTYRRGYPAQSDVSYENTGIRCVKDAP